MVSTDSDLVYKILLLGDSEVGKSCFLMRYADNVFVENYISTIGLDYKLKYIQIESGEIIKVQLWDTAGQDRYRTIAKNYYKGSHGILLLYDVTKKESFDNIKEWIKQIREEVSEKTIIFLVGNKIDKTDVRKITTEEGAKLAEEYKLPFYETSAKTGENIEDIFNALYKKIGEVYTEFSKSNGRKLNQGKKGNDKKKKCC